MSSHPVRDQIEHKLRAAFSPIHLEIQDESARHVGHAGHNPAGESHFRILIVSDSFTDKSRVDCHRMVYDCLAPEMEERIHALALTTKTVQEYNCR